jgi:hypothetical protein
MSNSQTSAVNVQGLKYLLEGINRKVNFSALPSDYAKELFTDQKIANAVNTYLFRYGINKHNSDPVDRYEEDPYYGYRFVATIGVLVGGAKDGEEGEYAAAYDYLWDIDRRMGSAYLGEMKDRMIAVLLNSFINTSAEEIDRKGLKVELSIDDTVGMEDPFRYTVRFFAKGLPNPLGIHVGAKTIKDFIGLLEEKPFYKTFETKQLRQQVIDAYASQLIQPAAYPGAIRRYDNKPTPFISMAEAPHTSSTREKDYDIRRIPLPELLGLIKNVERNAGLQTNASYPNMNLLELANRRKGVRDRAADLLAHRKAMGDVMKAQRDKQFQDIFTRPEYKTHVMRFNTYKELTPEKLKNKYPSIAASPILYIALLSGSNYVTNPIQYVQGTPFPDLVLPADNYIIYVPGQLTEAQIREVVTGMVPYNKMDLAQTLGTDKEFPPPLVLKAIEVTEGMKAPNLKPLSAKEKRYLQLTPEDFRLAGLRRRRRQLSRYTPVEPSHPSQLIRLGNVIGYPKPEYQL